MYHFQTIVKLKNCKLNHLSQRPSITSTFIRPSLKSSKLFSIFCCQPNLSLSCHAVSPLNSYCRPFSFFFFLSGEFIVIYASNKYIFKISFCDEVIQIAYLGNFNSTNGTQSISEFLSYHLHQSNPHSSTPRSSH